MATYTWNGNPALYKTDWNIAANWQGGVVPNAADATVIIPTLTSTATGQPVPYEVDVGAGESFTIAALSLGAYLSIEGALDVLGVVIGGQTVALQGGTLALGGPDHRVSYTVQASGSGTIESAGILVNAGLMIGYGLTVTAAGFTNTGTLIAGGGDLALDVSSGTAELSNLVGGTISGGSFEAMSAGTLALIGVGPIVVDAAPITLSGFRSMIDTVANGMTVALQASLKTVSATGTLTIGGLAFAAVNPLDIAGTLVLGAPIGSQTLSAPSITLEAGALASGSGAIVGPISGSGTLQASGGALTVASTSGVALQVSLGTLEVTGSTSGGVTFETPDDNSSTGSIAQPSMLIIDDLAGFTGTIAGLNTLVSGSDYALSARTLVVIPDQIVLAGVRLSDISNENFRPSPTGGTLSFMLGTQSVSLQFASAFPLTTLDVAAGPQPYSNSTPSVVITEPTIALAGLAPQLTGALSTTGHTIYAAQNNATISLMSGDQTITLLGTGDVVSLTSQAPSQATNNVVLGSRGSSTITLAAGYQTVVAFGSGNTIAVGNAGTVAGLLGSLSYVDAGDANNAVTAGSGTNVIKVGGYHDTITTAGGLNLIFATDLGTTAPGGTFGPAGFTTLTLGVGNNFAYLHGASNSIVDGSGVDAVWGGTGGGDSFTLSAGGGALFIENFGAGDTLDLTKILAGVPLAADLSNIGNYVSVVANGTDDMVFGVADGGSKTVLQIAGPNGTEFVNLENVGSIGVAALLSSGAFVLPTH